MPHVAILGLSLLLMVPFPTLYVYLRYSRPESFRAVGPWHYGMLVGPVVTAVGAAIGLYVVFHAPWEVQTPLGTYSQPELTNVAALAMLAGFLLAVAAWVQLAWANRRGES